MALKINSVIVEITACEIWRIVLRHSVVGGLTSQKVGKNHALRW